MRFASLQDLYGRKLYRAQPNCQLSHKQREVLQIATINLRCHGRVVWGKGIGHYTLSVTGSHVSSGIKDSMVGFGSCLSIISPYGGALGGNTAPYLWRCCQLSRHWVQPAIASSANWHTHKTSHHQNREGKKYFAVTGVHIDWLVHE